jgi:hypothetical protein
MKQVGIAVFLGLFVGSATTSVAGIVFQDNFDSYSDSPTKHGWNYIGSQVSTPSTEGKNGTRGLKVTYNSKGTGPFSVQKSIAGSNLQQVYVKFDFKVDNPSGGSKFLKFFGKSNSPSGYANSTFAINYNSGTLFEISYGAGSTENDTQNVIRYSGTHPDSLKAFDRSVKLPVTKGTYDPRDGKWHSYQVFMRYNSNGKRDGEYKIWIDGTLHVHATNVVNRNDKNSLFFDSFRLGDYCSSAWERTWNIWYDNVVVSTDYIGSGPVPDEPPASTTPDAPPASSQPDMVQDFKEN